MSLINLLQDTGDYAYSTARCRAIMSKMQEPVRETKEVFESKVDKELEDFEKKLVRISPKSLKDDLSLFMESRRETEVLKIQFRKYNLDKRRREGVKVIQLSKWGVRVNDRMSNKEVELAIDSQWFHVMKSTVFREFVIDLEQSYMKWYNMRIDGKKFDFNPLSIIKQLADSDPLSWPVILKCYYVKLKQIQDRRIKAWEGY